MSENQGFLTHEEAYNCFQHIIKECEKALPIIKECDINNEDAEKVLYRDHLAPIIIQVEYLRKRYLYMYNLNISEFEMRDNELPYLLFFVLSRETYLFEIFDGDERHISKIFKRKLPELFKGKKICGVTGCYEPCEFTVKEFAKAIMQQA